MRAFLGVVLAVMLGGVAWAQEAPVVGAENAFAVDLYGALSARPGNLFFSPYSISTALEMVFVGARGRTADEVARVLHLEMLGAPPGDLRAAVLADVKAQVLFPDPALAGFRFNSANALWGADGCGFEPKFVAALKADFGGVFRAVDFGNPVAAAAEINDWVAHETGDKITALVSPAALSAATRLVLTNAVYFKAGWEFPFDPSATDTERFHVTRDRDVDVHMMHEVKQFVLARDKGVRILALPYRDDDASLVILLPDEDDGLQSVETGLTPAKLSQWLDGGQETQVALALPKMRSTQDFDLNDVLKRMGIRAAFDPMAANLTGIADGAGDELFVSDVIHKAYVDMDEKGTEASAATAVIVSLAGMAPPMEAVPFVVDHPFIYLIRANQTGVILFMGRVEDPMQQGD